MKKKLSYLFGSIGLSIILLAIPSIALAAEEGSQNIVVNEEDAFFDPVSGKKINAYKVVDGQLISVDKEEYQILTEDVVEPFNNGFSTSPISPMAYLWYQYTPSTSNILSFPIKRVSADIDCNTPSCTVQKDRSITVTESFTAGLSAGEEKAIIANAGFTWSKEASNTSTYSFTINKGTKGYIGFAAKYRKTTGTLKAFMDSTLLSTQQVEARSPKTIDGTANGELDGVYTFVYQ